MDRARVFVVDDNVVARGMLSKMLSGFDEVEIVGEAGTGQGGIIMLEEVNPDIVMLETAIGGGMKITDIIKEMKRFNPEMKIILCTDPAKKELVIPATNAGADDFVSKPYRKNEMLRAIHNSIRKKNLQGS